MAYPDWVERQRRPGTNISCIRGNIISMKRHRYGTKKRDVRRRRLANISEELLKMVLSRQSKSRIRCSSLTLQFVNMVQAVLYVRSERIFTAT